MALDFNVLAVTTKEMLDANGRTITVRRLNRTPDDVDKPWRAKAAPRGTPLYEEQIKVVFVEPYSLIRYGFTRTDVDECARLDVVVIASGKDFTDLAIDPFGLDEIEDQGVIFNVSLVRQLSPATPPLLYVIAAKR